MLKDRLLAIGVEVNIETFEEEQGIAGLGDDPFVSLSFSPVNIVILTQYS